VKERLVICNEEDTDVDVGGRIWGFSIDIRCRP